AGYLVVEARGGREEPGLLVAQPVAVDRLPRQSGKRLSGRLGSRAARQKAERPRSTRLGDVERAVGGVDLARAGQREQLAGREARRARAAGGRPRGGGGVRVEERSRTSWSR